MTDIQKTILGFRTSAPPTAAAHFFSDTHVTLFQFGFGVEVVLDVDFKKKLSDDLEVCKWCWPRETNITWQELPKEGPYHQLMLQVQLLIDAQVKILLNSRCSTSASWWGYHCIQIPKYVCTQVLPYFKSFEWSLCQKIYMNGICIPFIDRFVFLLLLYYELSFLRYTRIIASVIQFTEWI